MGDSLPARQRENPVVGLAGGGDDGREWRWIGPTIPIALRCLLATYLFLDGRARTQASRSTDRWPTHPAADRLDAGARRVASDEQRQERLRPLPGQAP